MGRKSGARAQSLAIRRRPASSVCAFLGLVTGVIERVSERFPEAELTLRADAGFALPEVFEYLDDHQVRYAIGMGSNGRLKKSAEPGMQIARALSEDSGDSQRVYVDKQYQTRKS